MIVEEGSFPFTLLVFRLKVHPTAQEPCCFCGHCQRTMFVCEHYVDAVQLWALSPDEIHEEKQIEEIVDRAWNSAIEQQQQGIFTEYAQTYQCLSCTLKVADLWAGMNAVIAVFPLMKRENVSLIFCSRVEHRGDIRGSVPGVMSTRLQTTLEISRQMQAQTIGEEACNKKTSL